MILILVVLFSPIPPMALDMAIVINFGFGLTILMLTFYVKKPTDFSTFPSLLLITTLFRLSLNIAATRLILTGGEAGQVIGSIGTFAVGGNFIVGLVVFSILIVVQYVVVTSGAQRVSEVAARFTLDSMPGQQMSIDADLNMGLIDQKEALRRREELEKEASFYGSMDGASKFVKGDAIAGIIIILIDIIAGWIIGVVQMGMGWGEALEHFTLLTIGDGIATQLPALIIAVATGIIVTRSSNDKELSSEVFKQLSSIPRIPIIVSVVLFAMMLMPGMPKWPMFILIPMCFLAYLKMRRIAQEAKDEDEIEEEATTTISKPLPLLEIGFGSELTESWKNNEATIMERISNLRDTHEKMMGIGFPNMKIVDSEKLGSMEYEIKLFGTQYASGTIHPDMVLAIKGDNAKDDIVGMETTDPAFGLPALWIEGKLSEKARDSNYTIIDPLTVLITHLGEIMRDEASTLLTRNIVVKLIEEVRDRQGGLIEELIPNLMTISDIQRVLQNLLSENVSIANIDIIVEHLVDLSRTEKDTTRLTELIRQRLSHSICNNLKDRHADLAVISLDPRVENQIVAAVNMQGGNTETLAVEPKLAQQLINKLVKTSGEMHRQGRAPVLLCGAEVRRQMRVLTRRALPKLAILSVNEIPVSVSLKSFDIVKIDS
uniref:flagellar biosynthesis protein FlhA n=1 Tax=Fretibacter rubidus TaxID=570162 RepID=UPI003FA1BFA1